MKQRILGNNHLNVSALGLGCWGMSHAYGRADETEALATLEGCLDLGINFLDTANVYGDGHNEALIAKVLKNRRREAVVGTKFGFTGDEHGNVRVNGRPEYVRAACEASLKRLGIDEIDLYYFHRLDPEVPIEETVGAMADLVRQGKVRYIGLSEVSAQTLARAHRIHPVTALQSEYSLWHREVESEILPTCRELGVSLVPFSPLGRGFLTGTLNDAQALESGDYRRGIPRFNAQSMTENQALIQSLETLARDLKATLSQLALAWLLSQEPNLVPIPGMKRRKYIRQNLGALDLTLPPEALELLAPLAAKVQGQRHNTYNLQFVDTTT